jgi:LysM repeat protein
MKPLQLILPAVLAAPAVVPLVSAVADDNAGSLRDDFLAGLVPDRLPGLDSWGDDASPATPPAVDPLLVASIGSGTRDLDKPLEPPAGAKSGGATSTVVRFGDTLVKIAERYGLSLAELLRLNPGLETARLVVGSQVRVAQSYPARSRSLLAVKPLGSGGVSWPELPEFGGQEAKPFHQKQTATTWVWPAKGVFTSGYGWRWGRMHKGIDVANNVGTPIVAARSGRVSYAGWHDGGYGYLVEITHEDGSLTLYAHNSRILVRVGDVVDQGQMISKMGSTGRSTGPHLHFEIHPAGRSAANPLQFLPPRA